MPNLLFILLDLIVFLALLFFIVRAGSGVGFYEQRYAKKIALMIDEAKPGTEIELDVSELIKKAGKNKYKGKIVEMGNEKNEVIVRLREGKGYSFQYFSDVKVLYGEEKSKLKMEIR